MGISDGMQLDVDGQQQAKGSSQIQLRPGTGIIMRTEQTKIGEDIPSDVSTTMAVQMHIYSAATFF
jgi:hypothetical protein